MYRSAAQNAQEQLAERAARLLRDAIEKDRVAPLEVRSALGG